MRVKAGDRWHAVDTTRAIMIELSDADRRNIANMAPGARFYACFDDKDARSPDEKLAWMTGQ